MKKTTASAVVERGDSMKQVAISLRINEEQWMKVKEKSNEIGVSQNALLNILIDLGLRCYGQIGVLSPNQNAQSLSG